MLDEELSPIIHSPLAFIQSHKRLEKRVQGRFISYLIRQRLQQANTQNHNQQPQRHNHQQPEPKPPQDHRRSADPAPHTPITQVLYDCGSGHGGCVLPHDADEHKHGGDKDGGEGDLADGAGGEGFDFLFGAHGALGVPAGEGGEEDEGEEGEDDGDDSTCHVIRNDGGAGEG
jgi:hypothetical protein